MSGFHLAHAFSPVSSTILTRDCSPVRLGRPPARRYGHAFCLRRSCVGISVALELRMLKLIGSYALAKLLGFGLFGAIVIYALLSLLT